jgi:hypothetical protein
MWCPRGGTSARHNILRSLSVPFAGSVHVGRGATGSLTFGRRFDSRQGRRSQGHSMPSGLAVDAPGPAACFGAGWLGIKRATIDSRQRSRILGPNAQAEAPAALREVPRARARKAPARVSRLRPCAPRTPPLHYRLEKCRSSAGVTNSTAPAGSSSLPGSCAGIQTTAETADGSGSSRPPPLTWTA